MYNYINNTAQANTSATFDTKVDFAIRYLSTLPSYRHHPYLSSPQRPSAFLSLLLKPDLQGYYPLHYAATSTNSDIVLLLSNIIASVRKECIDCRDVRGKTSLHWAALKGDVASMKVLFVHGANLNSADYDGLTALHHVLVALHDDNNDNKKNNMSITATASTKTVGTNANPTITVTTTKNSSGSSTTQHYNSNTNGNTNHHNKAKSEFLFECAKFLLENGANPNLFDMDGISPLHLAAEIGDVDVVELLYSYGAQVNVKDNEGENVLWYAVRGQHRDVVEVLLRDFEVDLDAKNNDDETIEEYCRSIGDSSEILTLIASHKPAMMVSGSSELFQSSPAFMMKGGVLFQSVSAEKFCAEQQKKAAAVAAAASMSPFSISRGSSYGLERVQAFA